MGRMLWSWGTRGYLLVFLFLMLLQRWFAFYIRHLICCLILFVLS